jgi:hypothetical protein
VRRDGEAYNIADVAFVPLQLNWTVDTFSFKLSETITAPSISSSRDESG